MVDPFLTVREVAERLRLSEKTIRRWIKAGRIRAIKISNRGGWRVRESQIDKVFEEPET